MSFISICWHFTREKRCCYMENSLIQLSYILFVNYIWAWGYIWPYIKIIWSGYWIVHLTFKGKYVHNHTWSCKGFWHCLTHINTLQALKLFFLQLKDHLDTDFSQQTVSKSLNRWRGIWMWCYMENSIYWLTSRLYTWSIYLHFLYQWFIHCIVTSRCWL